MKRAVPATIAAVMLVAAVPQPSVPVLVAAMDAPGQAYYVQTFDYVMEAVKAGQTHYWKTYQASGHITPGAVVPNKSTVCRRFSEAIAIGGQAATATGVGCKRVGREGWCRLGKDQQLMSCALEPPETGIESLGRDVSESLGRATTGAKSTKYRWWPF